MSDPVAVAWTSRRCFRCHSVFVVLIIVAVLFVVVFVIVVLVVVVLREALMRKKMFSFGHCPNYLEKEKVRLVPDGSDKNLPRSAKCT